MPPAPRPLRDFFLRLFCRHSWRLVSDERCPIYNDRRQKIGEVNVLVLRCWRCECTREISHDLRRHRATPVERGDQP